MPRLALTTLFALSLFPSLLTAQKPASSGGPPAGETEAPPKARELRGDPVQIHVRYESIQTDLATALRLLEEHPASASGGSSNLREALLRLAADGKAKINAQHTVAANPGDTATTSSSTEFIYPTAYEAPEHRTQGEGAGTTTTIKHLLPPAFETRLLGFHLEIEPVLGDDPEVVDLRVLPEEVVHESNLNYFSYGDRQGRKHSATFPVMNSNRMNTALQLKNGVPMLAGLFSPIDPETKQHNRAKREFVFVRADIETRPSTQAPQN